MSRFEHERENSPLPANLAAAKAEIHALRAILKRERELLAKKVMQRELDRRAAKGTFQALNKEIKTLRDENRDLKNLLREAKIDIPAPESGPFVPLPDDFEQMMDESRIEEVMKEKQKVLRPAEEVWGLNPHLTRDRVQRLIDEGEVRGPIPEGPDWEVNEDGYLKTFFEES